MQIETLNERLLDAALQGAALLVITALVAMSLRRAAAATRHLCWGLGMLSLLAVSVLSSLPASWQWLSVSALASARTAAAVSEVRAATNDLTPLAPVPGPAPVDRAIATESAPLVGSPVTGAASVAAPAATEVPVAAAAWPWQSMLLVAWTLGVLATLLPFMVSLWRGHRLVRGAVPVVGDDLRPLQRLAAGHDCFDRTRWLTCSRVAAPMTCGWLRPVVLLPLGFGDWSEDARRAAVLHELAHVRRGDWGTRLLARLAVALHWWNPLAWLAERRLLLASECACDDAVLAAGDAPSQYAGGLLAMARSLAQSRAPRVFAMDMAHGSQLAGRIRSILQPGVRRRGLGRAACWAAAFVALGSVFACAGVGVFRSQVETLVVAQNGSAAFRSVQAAVDAAAPGSIVRVEPGIYRERVTIDKALTLAGAGQDRTELVVDFENPLAGDERLQRLFEEAVEAAPEAERPRVRREMVREHGPKPTLAVRTAGEVVVRGLRLSQPGAIELGIVTPGSVVAIEHDRAGGSVVIDDCAVVGAPGTGIEIRGPGNVRVQHSLVAGVGATGIAVASAAARVEVLECDVRNCVHRGITVARGNATTTIARCRISGSSWHGIRYDDAAPTIRDNRIVDNARFGIYASGKTSGTIESNLFVGNALGGISCWFDGRDTVAGNTFTGGQEHGVSVHGAGRPRIVRNLFCDLPAAVRQYDVAAGDAGQRNTAAMATGELDLVDNAFWQVEKRALRFVPGSNEPVAVASADGNGNRACEAPFAVGQPGTFVLAAASQLRDAKIGVSDPLPSASPWPPLPAEAVAAPRSATPERRQVAPDTAAAASKVAKGWADDIASIDAPDRRSHAIAAVTAALQSTDLVQRHAALLALSRTYEVAYDKEPFRELLLPICREATGDLQRDAFYALNTTSRLPEDKQLLFAALQQPEGSMRLSGTHLLLQFCDGAITGEASDFALRLLAGSDQQQLKEALRGLWGATASDAVQARMLAIAALPEMRHEAVYFGLSTLQNKNADVVRLLLEVAAGTDPEQVDRALWGLGQGVQPAQRGDVCAAALRLFAARTGMQTRLACLSLVGRYGSAENLPELRRLVDLETLSEAERGGVQRAIGAIEGR